MYSKTSPAAFKRLGFLFNSFFGKALRYRQPSNISLLLLGGEDNQEEIQLAIGKLTGEARKSFMR